MDHLLDLPTGAWQLEGMQVIAGSNAIPTATVSSARRQRQTNQDASIGDGPVDAIYSAIARLTGIKATVSDYRIRAVTRGKEAQGEVIVELEQNGSKVRGRGLSTDILEASACAYLAAVNRLRSLASRQRRSHAAFGGVGRLRLLFSRRRLRGAFIWAFQRSDKTRPASGGG